MSDLRKKLAMNRLPSMPPSGMGRPPGGSKFRTKKDFSPTLWSDYFSHTVDVKVDEENTFRLYEAGDSGPVCFFLHGGGYSGLSWALLSKALTAEVNCRCVALDMRGHGDTVTANEEELSTDVLSKDVVDVIRTHYGDDPPPIILVGHSMGGAIAVHVAQRKLIPSLIGLAVIDVVEGTALDALHSMQSFLRNRPTHFQSIEKAIEYCIKSGTVRNLESAKVSMTGQLKRCDTSQTASSEVTKTNTADEQPSSHQPTPQCGSILEEDDTVTDNSSTSAHCDSSETAGSSQTNERLSQNRTKPTIATHDTFTPPSQSSQTSSYTWRIDLSKTEPYWEGWFRGLSSLFLSCDVPKILLLAGTVMHQFPFSQTFSFYDALFDDCELCAGVDRLDKQLTVGQMQGKFQMQVLPQCGHAVHEDVPDKLADVLATFMIRHKVAEPKADFERAFPSC